MKPQIITTGSGEELVVLSRPDYDTLLARAGDEEAEDRVTARMTDAHLAARATGSVDYAPQWLSDALLNGRSVIVAAREQAGMTRNALAEGVGITSRELEEFEAERTIASPELLRRIASATGVDTGWLGLDD